MTEFEERCLALLERIASAVEGKPKPVKAAADLFGAGEERSARGKKPLKPMPEPFHINDKHRAFAAARGIVGAAADYQFDRFKAHHLSKGSQFASWDQAWQTWVLNQARFNGTAPNTRPPNDGMDGRI